MRAMILAAGLGTRLKPFTDFHPKALAIVNGKSLLQRNIEYLQSFGISEVVVNVHHFADQIKDAVEINKGWGSQVFISDESSEVLETGGGVLYAKSFFEKEENWLVMNADILTNLDIDKLIAADKVLSEGSENYIATLAVTSRVSSRNLIFSTDGNLIGWKNNTTREEKWAIINTHEQPADNHAISKAFSGIQILHSSFYSTLGIKGKFSLIDAYLQTAAKGTIGYYDHSDSILIDVGKPENIEKAESLFK
ncbi:MAG: nucleotidyltransferase family protein [Chitinophagia bacterium]|jgi:NDP-sugar pyrophosphorylase family protein|nr:nucleotidyltransferase family protein [Chitinophagia bacterium]NCA30066.1 nucleotidyltransferase family protein [Chitinophagia bacterium]NDD16982.1 nucleotidyltransferase family protein [Chitinophagia bacterium]